MECERPAGAEDRPFAHDRSEEVGADLPNPAQRDRLVLVEIGDKGEEAGPVLSCRRDSRGSRSDGDLLAGGQQTLPRRYSVTSMREGGR